MYTSKIDQADQISLTNRCYHVLSCLSLCWLLCPSMICFDILPGPKSLDAAVFVLVMKARWMVLGGHASHTDSLVLV